MITEKGLELKAVKDFTSVFEAQLLTYMKLLKAPKGILINFNSANIFSEGQRTYTEYNYKIGRRYDVIF